MRIQELIIKNFGKFADKEIRLSDGINLIYGENESGKSTIHTFIKSMLFGLERGRGRASLHDTYSRCEPWENPNYYAGKLRFQAGGRSFVIDRNFDKYSRKAELLCEDDGEELSVADGDLAVLLGGISTAGYEDTISVGQLRAEPGETLAAELRNYAMNYYATGDSEIDLQAAMALLKERRRELDRETREAAEEKQHKREQIEQEVSYVWRDVHRLRENQESIDRELSARAEKEEQEPEAQQQSRWRIHPAELLLFVAVVILPFVLIPKPWSYLVAIILFLACGIYVWNRMKISKKHVKTAPEILLESITPEEEKIPLEKLVWEKGHVEEELQEKQVQYDNLKEQLEELDEWSDTYKEQDKRCKAIQLAMDQMEDLAAEFQAELEFRLNTRASEIICDITGGKYTRLLVEDNLHMSLLSNGKKIPMEQVSRGTIEQTWFALRMAAGELLYSEEYPVILDDTFAFYDDDRLRNTLRWLNRNRRQVLIFTCQKREGMLLKEEGIPYTDCAGI